MNRELSAAVNKETPDGHNNGHIPHKAGFASLFIGCIGVVYGDIGTSPLYAFREALHAVNDHGITEMEVYGVTSLLIWALIIVVALKYILFIMRADNNGEGGILSLMALVGQIPGNYPRSSMLLGIIGAALFYGDAAITPAISVLSAVEGMKLITPALETYVIPLTLVILVVLFVLQSNGTEKIARFFGPITLLWFIAMAVAALPHLAEHPEILRSFSPYYGAVFLLDHSVLGLVVLGAVFLVVTGGEALYADMGHFGRRPIRFAWMSVVFPALTLNYLGQGALILQNPDALKNPFFLMVPEWALIPMVILATLATIIASQAVISGAYSLTRQAIQLGLLPRLEMRFTSEKVAGQIFLPRINTLLLVGVLILVLEFKSSGALASAYGIAVTGTMVITTLLAFLVMWKVWKKPLWMTLLVIIPFLLVDITFLVANLLKVMDGGYVPLALGFAIVIIMLTWRRGSQILKEKTHKDTIPLVDFLAMMESSSAARVPGTAVFLTNDPTIAPTSLMHNMKHNKVLHETNVIMSVQTESTPYVSDEQRVSLEKLSEFMYRAVIRFGYMETPNVSRALTKCRKLGLKFDIMSTSFFMGRRIIKASANSGMSFWQDRLFIALAENATNATEFFHIPRGRVVELGSQITV